MIPTIPNRGRGFCWDSPSVLMLIGLDNLDDRELALEGFGVGAFCAALFFLPDLRELMSRWPWRD